MGEIILGVIIIALIVERFFYSREMTARLGDTIKAVMSRNIGEYIAATKPVKEKKELVEDETVDLSAASDEEFDKFIKNQTT